MTDHPDVITFDEFAKIKLRVGKIISAADHPDADRLIVLQVDLGDHQRQLCAGLRGHYLPQQLVGKNIVVAANLAPRTMRGQISEGMLLAASDQGHEKVVLLTTESDIAPGSSVS